MQSIPTQSQPSSGSSATILAVVGGCLARIALLAGAVVLVIVLARSRRGYQKWGSPTAVEVELCDGVEGQENALLLANPPESVDILVSTT
jgi:hypothetical protein